MNLAVPIILTVVIVCAGIAAAIPILQLMHEVAASQRHQQETAQQRLVSRHAAAYLSGPPHPGVCPICGMDDPDHLEARWRTWPVHTDCLDWLMPGGPSFVDEYTDPALSSGDPKRSNILGGVTAAEANAAIAAMFATAYSRPEHSEGAGRRREPRNYPTKGGYESGDTPAHCLPPIPGWLMERQSVEVTTLGDAKPVYVPGGIITPGLPPSHTDPKLIAAMFAADNDRPEHISKGWEL